MGFLQRCRDIALSCVHVTRSRGATRNTCYALGHPRFGQVMRTLKGQGNPQVIRAALAEALERKQAAVGSRQ